MISIVSVFIDVYIYQIVLCVLKIYELYLTIVFILELLNYILFEWICVLLVSIPGVKYDGKNRSFYEIAEIRLQIAGFKAVKRLTLQFDRSTGEVESLPDCYLEKMLMQVSKSS